MGAWSGEPFGNDEASGWAFELEDADDWTPVEEALQAVLDDPEPDSETATIAIAAAEVVAGGLGQATQEDSYTEEVASFVAKVDAPSKKLVKLAQKALSKATAEDSELAELWESDEEWLEANAKLALALK